MIRSLTGALLLAVLPACDLLGGNRGLEDVELGEFPISDTGAYVDVTLTVPEGTTSTMAYCGTFGNDALGAVWTLTDPSGNEVYNGKNPAGSAFRSDFVDDLSPMVLPMSPNLRLTPGDWQVQWFIGAGSNASSVDCAAVHRTDDVSSDAAINVELVFVGIDVNADTAADDANLTAALDQFEAEWASAGLSAAYEYKDFDGNVARFSVVDIDTQAGDYAEFNALLATTNQTERRSITFFLVQEISDGPGGAVILGLAGGPPGAATVDGTSKSGVIVSAADLANNPATVGKIMAHEGGHFLGLYHTTESNGSQNDTLDDTPNCGIASDADNSGTLSTSECPDGTNVMFWTLTDGTASMSGDQSWVLVRNPAVQ